MMNQTEWSVQRLYLQRAYKQAQTIALDILFAAGVQLDSDNALVGNPHPHPHPHPAGTPLSKNKARDREMFDTDIRCALKLGDPTTAHRLAEASRSRAIPPEKPCGSPINR
ncbi:hypothetical protein V565_351930, partial [Rhizoctonia solani 123E]